MRTGRPRSMMMKHKQRELAKRELARRELARRELIAFAWYTFHGYQAAAVHYALAHALEQVGRYIATGGREGIGRLMVFMPPRHGKSELVSRRFPAWFLGRNSDKRVILTSCTADLATSFSRQARDIIADNAYQRLWGDRSGKPQGEWVQISDEVRAASAWDLKRHRGGLVSAGVGGTIVGRGAHLAIIDDPFKNRKEAESKSVRDGIDQWYKGTLYPRLEDGAAIVLMHQRWHGDDLAGRLIQRMIANPFADQWTILCLPAIAEPWAEAVDPEKAEKAAKDGWVMVEDALGREPGEALWTEKYDLDALRSIEINQGTYDFVAQYQQRPQRLEGAMINAYQIIRVRPDQVPDLLREVRYWDLAVSGKARADSLSGGRAGRAADGRTYIQHIDTMPGPWAEAKPKIRDRMLMDPARVTQGIEVSGQQLGYYQEFKRDPALALRSIDPVNPREVGNKEVRAQVWASRIQDELIYVVDDGTWDVDGFIEECIAFPTGAHDDQVDAVSGAIQMLGGWMGSLADVPQGTGDVDASVWREMGFEGFGQEGIQPWQLR